MYMIKVMDAEYHINDIVDCCHDLAKARGWWTDLNTGAPLDRNVGEMLCLIHSEISEAMEGHRTKTMDEHCPEFKSIEIELADALIRIFDLAGGLDLRLGAALTAKISYNAEREDHSLEARLCENGKKF